MFSYSEAIPILKANGAGADVSAASAYRSKYGFGLNWEQEIAKNVGVFSRLGWNDGQEEAWMFTDVDYTASLGLSVKGEAWHRPWRHLWSGGPDERHHARGAGVSRSRRLGHSGGRRQFELWLGENSGNLLRRRRLEKLSMWPWTTSSSA
jgi:hypothetical protein